MKRTKLIAEQLVPVDDIRNDTSDNVIKMIDNPDSAPEECLKFFNFPIVTTPYKQTDKYLVLDGNQRSIGFSLRGKSIDSIILYTQEDLDELLKLKQNEEMPRWPYNDCTLKEIYVGVLNRHNTLFTFEEMDFEDDRRIYTLNVYIKSLIKQGWKR